MKKYSLALATLALVLAGGALSFEAQAQEPEMPELPPPPEIEGFDFVDDPDEFKAVATGGVPMGRWKEGLLFEGIEPMPWLASAANWFPGTEEVQPDEIRVTFMGTAPMIRPGQMNTSVYYAKGCDLYITETQAELMSISSGVAGVPPFVGRYTIDTHHTPTYALGYLCDKIQPRLCMSTHMQHDPYQDAEVIAEVREHWDGPYHPGAPDMVVVNMTKDKIWARDGVIADYPNNKAPNADLAISRFGGLIVPKPQYSREDLQEQSIRDAQIDPELYYPEGYMPHLMEEWPTDKDLFLPEPLVPDSMKPGTIKKQKEKEASE